MKYYSVDVKEVFQLLHSSASGLSEKEAKDRLYQYGKNKIEEAKKKSNIHKFLDEFKDLMVIVLMIAAVFSFTLSFINKESYIDSIIILAIVILNAILGFMQELKADKAIESLKKLQTSLVKVKRENEICMINSEEVVEGDIIILEAGDRVPADARIIWAASLKVDESSLTGESVPVSKNDCILNKDTSLPLRKNMVYTGTNVVYGKCHAIVCKTGMNTEFGLIAQCLNQDEKEITPLQKRIDGISKFLSFVIFIIIVIMFFIGMIKGMHIMEIIMLSISLAVAAIPEGLPAIITIILSLGMGDLAKKHAIVRKMSSVETLGSTEIICSDKTGTITQNKMQVVEVYTNNTICHVEELPRDHILLSIMALNNDTEKSHQQYIGDPTEVALYEACEKCIDIELLRKHHKRIGELPFDSNRKMMSTIHQSETGIYLYTKGSFDSIIKHCSYIYENGKRIKLNSEKIDMLKEIEQSESRKAYRVLAYAYQNLKQEYSLDESLENDLIFVGLSSMIDPPRVDVKDAISQCKMAHIRPIMITGDSLPTAISIAKEIGILSQNEQAVTGEYLDTLTEQELRDHVDKYTVYARVSPLNKLAIVNAWKQNGKIVAMTGDGVNDAPALKSADIGIGMGITGTEVSKNVSDIILTDDSFSTIVSAVGEGRRIYDNIRNVLVYLITGNIAEVFVVFLSLLFGIEIFSPIQLLYINLITDSIPAIALAFEKSTDDIMNRNIRKNKSFFTPFLIAKIGLSAIFKTVCVLLIYFVSMKLFSVEIATTMAFLTLILLEMIFAYSCRNLKTSVLNKGIFSNPYMNKSMLLLIIVQLLVFLTPLRDIFGITNLSIIQVVYCLFIVVSMFLLDELFKNILHRIFEDS